MNPRYTDIHQPIVERCRKGDEKAQYELYHLYARAMYNLCMRMVNHIGEAEDILQESFLEAFSRIDRFRGESTFGAWLRKIVVNRSINYLKKRKAELFEDMSIADSVHYDNPPDSENDWDIKKIQAAIQMLPDGYRVVLSLYLLEGYDHAEIAEILHITESTSKSQYNRAKNKLREQLKQEVYGRTI